MTLGGTIIKTGLLLAILIAAGAFSWAYTAPKGLAGEEGNPGLAIALLIATVAKLVCERLVKVVSSRQRPGTSIGPDVHLRGDVSPVGESFVSGHAVLIAAIAGLVTPYLPGRWKIVPWIVVGLVMVTRVYVGAHNPLDVVCGAGLGLAIAGLINLFLGPRAKDRAA